MKRTKTAALIGLPLNGVGYSMIRTAAEQGESLWTGRIVCFAGTIAFLFACTWFARGRGHSGWFGAFGLIGLFGLLPLQLLKDQFKCCETGGENCKHGAGTDERDWSSRAA